MVSKRMILGRFAILFVGVGLSAQTASLRPETRDIPPPAPAPAAPAAISPEMRGDIFMARKMYREAIESYREVLGQSPIIHNKMGIAYHQSMDLANAKKYYERAVKLNPKYSEAINNVGTVHYAQKSYRRAVNQYRKALKLAPNSASIHSNLGTAYFARKNYKEAAKEYERALSLDPEVFEHRSTQGVLLQERTVQERAKFYFYLSKTYAKAGVTDRALLYIRKALEEGFKDRGKFLEEPEFTALKELPEFQTLMKMEVRAL